MNTAPVTEVVDAIADRLADPVLSAPWRPIRGRVPQSLSHGAAGIALLHIERAATGHGTWRRAHDWMAAMVADGITTGVSTGLYLGAPAVAFTLHAATRIEPTRYRRPLDQVDRQLAEDTAQRLDTVGERLRRGTPPALAEFDLIRGLAGIGAYLLHTEKYPDLVERILAHLVGLTATITVDGASRPGWWSDLGPAGVPSPVFPGGHANNGVAHGIAGPLALLSLAAGHGVRVDGQHDAIAAITAWLDDWRQESSAPWWPYWITEAEHRSGRTTWSRPARPSWCYGTGGLARAQHLAAIARNDTDAGDTAVAAFIAGCRAPDQAEKVVDPSLCHGHAGLLHIAARIAEVHGDPRLPALTRHLLDRLVPHDAEPVRTADNLIAGTGNDPGFLAGAAGVALALHTAAAGTAPASGWDTALLIA